MNDVKDSIANATTIAGPGGIVLGWNETLTLILILTGIVLNLVRIYEIRKNKKNGSQE
jgi:hypothetical protein